MTVERLESLRGADSGGALRRCSELFYSADELEEVAGAAGSLHDVRPSRVYAFNTCELLAFAALDHHHHHHHRVLAISNSEDLCLVAVFRDRVLGQLVPSQFLQALEPAAAALFSPFVPYIMYTPSEHKQHHNEKTA